LYKYVVRSNEGIARQPASCLTSTKRQLPQQIFKWRTVVRIRRRKLWTNEVYEVSTFLNSDLSNVQQWYMYGVLVQMLSLGNVSSAKKEWSLGGLAWTWRAYELKKKKRIRKSFAATVQNGCMHKPHGNAGAPYALREWKRPSVLRALIQKLHKILRTSYVVR
jgi:hypothetical protein